ncbi:hypothetical protein [Acetobacter oeni]|uniref:Uncharacterized protein n=1 Tax=Acetobacter oeni TaxID=304077 RepID=A0A511XGU9_9PROT|nr:hypothetical protein [Acetobacter oeni]MBB3882313.1 putative coiled-coil protein SlyX [Acetobacter oeni]NHO18582.1 hypothetical protein [Acetobacter oeni]GBR02191.1 hypothetical protein AA21952_0665 [Acetobacter oeni LMG 21952]GEN62175.1 hypothetical protein AOE01nite_03990 [Acetobacter oeni]
MNTGFLKAKHPLDTDPQEDLLEAGAEEAALRALNRMGSHKGSKPVSRPVQSGRPAEDTSSRLSLRSPQDTNQVRKRRFVRDGDIPVEHHNFSRSQPRATPFAAAETALPQNNRALEAEKRARADAERHAHDLEVSQRSLETRLGHAEMLLTELKQTLATREMELADRTAELATERASRQALRQEMKSIRPSPKPASVKESRPETGHIVAGTGEPQPVKWWKD